MPARPYLLLALTTGCVAFAPAPFFRPSRHGGPDGISLPAFQGRWRVVSMRQTSATGQHKPYPWNVGHVGVKGDEWTFEYDNGNGATAYQLAIDAAKQPAHLDLWSRGERPTPTPGQGIIRKRGDTVEIIYIFGANNRPASFDRPPDNQYFLTLRRVGS